MNRRDFLQILSSVAASSALPASFFIPRLASAAGSTFDPDSARYFVLVRMAGGWDVTLGLDPKTHAATDTQDDMFLEYAPDKIIDAAGVPLAPAAAALLPFKGQFSVINGLITASRDNGHDANLNYVSTGNGEGKAPSLTVELANSAASGPLGVVFSGSTNSLDRQVMISSIGSVESLAESLKLTDFQNYIANSGTKDDYYQGQQALLKSAGQLDDLIARLGKVPPRGTSSAEHDAQILAVTFASGNSLQGQIDIQGLNLDTHSSHEGAHLREQSKGWSDVAAIFNVFRATPIGTRGQSLFDRTVFMVISEFGRTPSLNTAKGKDHNPLTNSVLLAGGLVKGGQVIGQSHLITKAKSITGASIHTALPIDFTSLKVAQTRKEAEAGAFQYITPEPLVASIAQAMQVDWKRFNSVPANTPTLPNLFK